MTQLEQIEKSVAELTYEEFWAFAAWFNQLQDERWDREMEADAKAGKLDKLIAETLKSIAPGEHGRSSGCNLALDTGLVGPLGWNSAVPCRQ